jgi:L-aminopeptidase/D-esterase-like protein
VEESVVKVGLLKLNKKVCILTEVTAISPILHNVFQIQISEAMFVDVGFRKLARCTQVEELVKIETQIITGFTSAVTTNIYIWVVYTLINPENLDLKNVNVVVGWTHNGVLNDIRTIILSKEDRFSSKKNPKSVKLFEF